MSACVAYGCTNRPSRKVRGLSFHRFPKDKILRLRWIKAVRRLNWIPSKCSTLCSQHFAEADIDRTSLVTVRLRENVVPTIFPAYPTLSKRGIKESGIVPSKIEASEGICKNSFGPSPSENDEAVISSKDWLTNLASAEREETEVEILPDVLFGYNASDSDEMPNSENDSTVIVAEGTSENNSFYDNYSSREQQFSPSEECYKRKLKNMMQVTESQSKMIIHLEKTNRNYKERLNIINVILGKCKQKHLMKGHDLELLYRISSIN